MHRGGGPPGHDRPPARAERAEEEPRQRAHALTERKERRTDRAVRARRRGPERPHQAAASLRGVEERREDRGCREVPHASGVDPADEGIDEDVDDPPAELVGDERPDRAVGER